MRTKTVVVSDPYAMAQHVIVCEKYIGQPKSAESVNARSKKIAWRMNVDPNYVEVERRNDAKTTSSGEPHERTSTHYIYHTRDQGDFEKLVSATKSTRDKLLKGKQW